MDTLNLGDFEIRIKQDTGCANPRNWDNLGTMYIRHGNYCLGDLNAKPIPDDFNVGISLPIYLYDHGYLMVSTKPFSCRFDSSLVGHICVVSAKVRKELNRKRLTKSLRQSVLSTLQSEVDIYNQYLTGEVYGYEIVRCDSGIVVDSCWGYFDYDYCKSDAVVVVKTMQSARRKKRIKKLKAWIKNDVALSYRVN